MRTGTTDRRRKTQVGVERSLEQRLSKELPEEMFQNEVEVEVEVEVKGGVGVKLNVNWVSIFETCWMVTRLSFSSLG